MSPLERIKAHPLPFAELLGVEFTSAELDAVEARMLVRPDLCTLSGFAHGGAIMSLADTLGAAAAFVNLASEAKGTTTLESKTNFVAGARSGQSSSVARRSFTAAGGRRSGRPGSKPRTAN